jgi:hypothetical protein
MLTSLVWNALHICKTQLIVCYTIFEIDCLGWYAIGFYKIVLIDCYRFYKKIKNGQLIFFNMLFRKIK